MADFSDVFPRKRQKLSLKVKGKQVQELQTNHLKHFDQDKIFRSTAERQSNNEELSILTSGDNKQNAGVKFLEHAQTEQVISMNDLIDESSDTKIYHMRSIFKRNKSHLQEHGSLRDFPASKVLCLHTNTEEVIPEKEDQKILKINDKQLKWKPFPKPCRKWLLRKPLAASMSEIVGHDTENISNCDQLKTTTSPVLDSKSTSLNKYGCSYQTASTTIVSGRAGKSKTNITEISPGIRDADVNPAAQSVASVSSNNRSLTRRSPDTQDHRLSSKLTSNSANSTLDTDIPSTTDHIMKDVSLASCPLCQMQFSAGLTQIDKDGHIAVCFAACADDAIW